MRAAFEFSVASAASSGHRRFELIPGRDPRIGTAVFKGCRNSFPLATAFGAEAE